jgi:hypothetical protein
MSRRKGETRVQYLNRVLEEAEEKKSSMSKDLRGVYIFSQRPTESTGEILLLDGKQIAFTSREKAVALRKTGKTRGFRMQRATLCQSDVCIPATVDPEPGDFERIQRFQRFKKGKVKAA